MKTRSRHYVAVLQALVDDDRAPIGERRAAAIALEIHKARVNGTVPAEHAPIPGESTTIHERVLTYEGGYWTVTCDGVRVESWRGEGEIRPERAPSLGDFLGVHVQTDTRSWIITGRLFGDMKSALQPGMRVHLVVHLEPDPRLGDLGVLIFQAMVSSMNWRLDGGRWHTRVELLGYRQSEAAKAANLAIALRVLPEGGN